MQRYILGRMAQAVVALLVISVIVFALGRLTGDPLDLLLPTHATPEQIETTRQHYGLDQPYMVQYWKFLSNAVRGDFGMSIRYQQPSMELVFDRFPNTAQLVLVSMVISICIAVPIGILSAVKRGSWLDVFGRVAALSGQSMPIFWVGIMLMWAFGVWLRVLPVAGMGGPANLILPAVTLGWYVNASLMRISRSSMLDVLDSEYIKMARIKGVPERLVIWKHALKNAAIPIITLAGMHTAGLLRGAIVTETVFAWPGLGRLALSAVYSRDFPLVQACVLFMAALYIMINLSVDIIYAYIDPRIRYQR